MERARPPDDITPHEFFTRWLPANVAADGSRRARLGETVAALVFVLRGDDGAASFEFTVRIADGEVRGEPGRIAEPDLVVDIDVATWRQLNRGQISAPEALVRRRLKLSGNFVIALKLHLVLG
jgi:putative sterol carrier protein